MDRFLAKLMLLGALVFGWVLPASAQTKPLPDAPRPHTVDRKFLVAVGLTAAAKVADGITTERMLGRGCHETNSVYGPHPSALRISATQAAFFAGEVTAAYFLKRRFRRVWILPLTEGIVNVVGSIQNERLSCNGPI